MIVWLASYPRSGNTFARMLLYHGFGFPTYSIYTDRYMEDMAEHGILDGSPLPASREELAAAEETYFIKTHELPEDDNPAVYIVRDGREALLSYAHYIRRFTNYKHPRHFIGRLLGRFKFERLLDGLVREESGTKRDWSAHVLEWYARQAPTATILFDDLVTSPVEALSGALAEMNVAPQAEHGGIPSFEQLKERWPKFFRKGKGRDWRDEMSEEVEQLFWEHHKEGMKRAGFER